MNLECPVYPKARAKEVRYVMGARGTGCETDGFALIDIFITSCVSAINLLVIGR